VSDPTWANHIGIFQAAGLEISRYAYYDAERHDMDFEAMLADLGQASAGDVVLFHGCCHNPTGIDPDREQWARLAELCSTRGLLPLFDFAYQGFARGLDQDAEGLRLFVEQCDEILIASSFSKNFGIYGERTGAFTLVAGNAEVAATVAELRAQWEAELAAMRERIKQMRSLLVTTLKNKGVDQDFSFIERQNGMFSFSGLSKEQVVRMREDSAVYAVDSGRFNVAAMTNDNMDALCDAIAAVID
jgi:aromatic-amino-acid transaminase